MITPYWSALLLLCPYKSLPSYFMTRCWEISPLHDLFLIEYFNLANLKPGLRVSHVLVGWLISSAT